VSAFALFLGVVSLVSAVGAFIMISFVKGDWETGKPPAKTEYWPVALLVLGSVAAFVWYHYT
jgi:hypothetical protein